MGPVGAFAGLFALGTLGANVYLVAVTAVLLRVVQPAIVAST